MRAKYWPDVANVPKIVVGVPLTRCCGRVECCVGHDSDSPAEQADSDSDGGWFAGRQDRLTRECDDSIECTLAGCRS